MGDQLRASLKPFGRILLLCSRGFRGAHNWAPMMPRDVSLSDDCRVSSRKKRSLKSRKKRGGKEVIMTQCPHVISFCSFRAAYVRIIVTSFYSNAIWEAANDTYKLLEELLFLPSALFKKEICRSFTRKNSNPILPDCTV